MTLPKRRRIDQSRNAVTAIATTSTDSLTIPSQSPLPSPPCLTLTVECWKCIFDNLPLKDILVMGQTCKRMCEFSGGYISKSRFHPELDFSLIENLMTCENICIQPDFYRYIGKISIKPNDDFNFFSNVITFESLKTLDFDRHTFNPIKIRNMQNVLKNVETIQLTDCDFGRNIFPQLISTCPKLKYLKIFQYTKAENVSLFQHFCPTLERFDYLFGRYTGPQKRSDDLKAFLEKHTKLKHFEIDFGFFWLNRDMLSQANIKLDLLHLHVNKSFTITEFNEFMQFLKELYGRNFYKTLKLSLDYGFDFDDVEYLSKTIGTLPGLEKLMTVVNSFIDFTYLANLKELQCDSFDDMEVLAKSLPKLEQLTLKFVYNNEILPFVWHSKNLKIIEIHNMSSSNEDQAFDLFKLNEERKKLANASEVVICVQEKDYLAIKCKSQTLGLNLVKIARFYEKKANKRYDGAC